MIKLLIADDHHLFRDGLSRIINEIPEFDLRAVAQNGKEALDFALQHQPDVVLMDLHMPEMNGIEATEQILAQNPDIRILMLTISEEDDDLFSALRAGAGGYLLKNTSSQNLISAIKDIVAGKAPMSSAMTAKLLNQFIAGNPISNNKPTFLSSPEAQSLTKRELDVLHLVARGLSNKEIGASLSISQHTAKSHLHSILNKLNLRSRVEVAAWAIRKGMLRED